MMDIVLPDRILCKHVCVVGSIEQLRLCVTLILIQEKPTGFHSGSLSTNHASSRFLSPQFASNVDTNPFFFLCFLLLLLLLFIYFFYNYLDFFLVKLFLLENSVKKKNK